MDAQSLEDPFRVFLARAVEGKTTTKDGRSGSWQEQPGPPPGSGFGIFGGGGWKLMSPTKSADPAAAEASSGGDWVTAEGYAASGLGAEPFLVRVAIGR